MNRLHRWLHTRSTVSIKTLNLCVHCKDLEYSHKIRIKLALVWPLTLHYTAVQSFPISPGRWYKFLSCIYCTSTVTASYFNYGGRTDLPPCFNTLHTKYSCSQQTYFTIIYNVSSVYIHHRESFTQIMQAIPEVYHFIHKSQNNGFWIWKDFLLHNSLQCLVKRAEFCKTAQRHSD